jgi:[2-(trimethylamino)ethyl]phosphonate dioxygenase
MPIEKARIIDDGKAVDLTWTSGEKARFHALWLRDNALDGATRSASNGQRLITVLDIPAATRLSGAQVSTSGDLTLTFTPEGKPMTFPDGWLADHIYDRKRTPRDGWVAPEIETWDGGLAAKTPVIAHERGKADVVRGARRGQSQQSRLY